MSQLVDRLTKVVLGRKFLVGSVFLAGVAIFGWLVSYIFRAGAGDDDSLFVQLVQGHSLFDYVVWRYMTWSGRIFPEISIYIFAHAAIEWWRLANVLIYAALTFTLYKYYLICTTNRSRSRDVIAMVLIQAVPLSMSIGTFVDASLWVTGSMNYLWPLTLGVIAFYPLLKLSAGKTVTKLHLIVGLLLGMVAAASQEQIGIVLGAASFCLLVYYLLKKNHKKTIVSAAYLFTYIIGFTVSYLAPGNTARAAKEVAQRIPDFHSINLIDKIEYSLRWFLDASINHTGILLVLVWVLLFCLIYKLAVSNKLRIILLVIIGSAIVFYLARPYVGQVFEFYAEWGVESFTRLSRIICLYWIVVLSATVAAPLIVFRRKNKGLVISGLILLALLSLAVMVASPTMYASGLRVLYVSAYILSAAIVALFFTLMSIDKEKVYPLVILMLIFPAYQIIGLIADYQDYGFYIHLPWVL